MTAEPIAPRPKAALSTLCRDCLALVAGGGDACPRCGSPRIVSHPELGELAIAHIDCDAFYAAIEKRDDPSLRDKPVIVGHAGGRGVVTTACYVARRYGPRSAMPMFRALQLCPDAVVIPPDMGRYKRVSRQIRAILETVTPIIEPVSLDEAYLDLSAGIRLSDRPPAVLLAAIALEVEREIGITISIGLSFNKFLAKLASDLDKPRGFAVIGHAEAMDVLAPLPFANFSASARQPRASWKRSASRRSRRCAPSRSRSSSPASASSGEGSPGSRAARTTARSLLIGRRRASPRRPRSRAICAMPGSWQGRFILSAIGSPAGWRTPGSPAAPSSSSSRPPAFR